MTPEQQRIAIAEACGWTDVRFIGRGDDTICVGKPQVRPGGINVPDYPFDLNAMHEVENEVLTTAQMTTMSQYLHRRLGVLWGFATASQRAEAFLRTIGKWKECK